MKPSAKDFDVTEATSKCKKFLQDDLAPNNCRGPKGTAHYQTKCNCLSFLASDYAADELDGAAKYMVYWKGLKGEAQNALLSEWKRVAPLFTKYSFCCDVLPTVPGTAPGYEHCMICLNALQFILDVGRKNGNCF